MIPFERTWPYDIIMKDIYVPSCPFCGKIMYYYRYGRWSSAIFARGKKKLLVFPCCHGRVTIVDADQDYLLADTKLRKQ